MSFKERMRAWKGRIVSSSIEPHLHSRDQNAIPATTLLESRVPSLHTHPKSIVRTTAFADKTRLDGSEASTIIEALDRSSSQERQRNFPRETLQLELQDHSPRKDRNTSQGTVLVSEIIRGQDWIGFGVQADASNIDNLKLAAERGFYEQLDGRGIMRRRSMIRTVSKEDHLLGRGANPRTGVVTPGSTSQNNPLLHTSTPQTRIVSVPTRWRQQGDQWISLDAGEPSPRNDSVHHSDLVLNKTRKPQGPREPRSGGFLPENYATGNLKRAYALNREARTGNHLPQIPSPTARSHLPGAFPQSPEKEPLQVLPTFPTRDTHSRRKPIGSSLSNSISLNETARPRKQDRQAPQMPVTPIREPRNDTDRSFSAPGPRRQLFTMAESGTSTPQAVQNDALPSKQARQFSGIPHESSFLELRPTIETSPRQTHQKGFSTKNFNLDKELPCLPTNNGLYPQPRSTSSPTMLNTPRETTVTAECIQQPQDEMFHGVIVAQDQIWTKSDQESSPVLVKRIHQISRESECTAAVVPMYDNPPVVSTQEKVRPRVGGPKVMPQPYRTTGLRSMNKEHVADPFNTTIISTDTTIPVRWTQGIRQRPNLRSLPDFRLAACGTMLSGYQLESGPMSQSIASSLPDETRDLPMPQGVPRGLIRPQMPSRAIGMRQMPKVSQLRDIQNTTLTERRDQSKMTGTVHNIQIREDATDIASSSPKIATEDIVQHVSKEGTHPETKSNRQVSSVRIGRKCSRCEDGRVIAQSLNADPSMDDTSPRKLSTASANAPEMVLSVTVQELSPTLGDISETRTPKSFSEWCSSVQTTSATILNVEEDLRDHSVCCPECCKEGCHAACLGHSNIKPQSDPVKSRTLHRADSSIILTSNSSESSASNTTEESSGKVSFFKTALRSPFKQKRSIDVLSTSSKSTSSVQERATTTPVTTADTSPTLYNGANGASDFFGAVAAAKKAIGFDSTAESQENGLNQFMIPKKRSKSKKMLDTVPVLENTTHLVPAPVRIPSVSITKIEIVANESRKVSGSRPCSVVQSTEDVTSSKHRTVSNASGDIQMPTMSAMGLKDVWELLVVVPLEALKMWLHNNPEILCFGWSLLGHVWTWTCTITATSQLILNIVYIYSKTGRLKIKSIDGKDVSMVDFLRECLRSALYLLVLASLSVVMVRTMRIMILPLKFLWLVGRYFLANNRSRTTT